MRKDAPRFRILPPLALGVPLAIGIIATVLAGDPFTLPAAAGTVGLVLVGLFLVINGWALVLMVAHHTAVLPGGATRLLIDNGPFHFSRNPLYVGLIAFDIAVGLLWPSTWALMLVPVGVAALTWGAILPEERYLREKFGAEYESYVHRVRRWF